MFNPAQTGLANSYEHDRNAQVEHKRLIKEAQAANPNRRVVVPASVISIAVIVVAFVWQFAII